MMRNTRLIAAAAYLFVVTASLGRATEPKYELYQGPRTFFAMNAITPYHLAADGNPKIWEITAANLAKAKELGATHVRIDMWWHAIEPTPGGFQWELPDRVIREIAQAGLVPYPILCYNSKWSIKQSPATEDERRAFGRYVHELVARYGDVAPVFEMWNEPNIGMFWQPEPSPMDYVALLREAHKQAKDANPNVQLVGFALAGADYDFLEASYRLGAAAYTDGIAFHHYYITEDESLMEDQIFRIRQLMDMYGDAGEPLIISESGLSTGPSPAIAPSTREEQARGLVRKHLTALAAGVDQFYYFKLMDDRSETEPDGYWGMLEWDRKEKPSAQAYRTMTQQLRDTKYLGRLWGYEALSGQRDQAQVMAFETDAGDIVLSAWARFGAPEGGVAIQLPAESELQIVGPMGDELPLEPSRDGLASVMLTGDVVYVRGVSPRVREGLEIELAPSPLALGRGERQRVAVRFHNLGDNPRTVSLGGLEDALLKAGIVAIAEESELFALPGASAETEILVSLREESAPFPRRVFAIPGEFGARGALEIIQSPAVDIELVVRNVKQDRLSIMSRVVNLRPSLLEGEIAFSTNDRPTRFTKLGPSEAAEVPITLQLGVGEQRLLAEVQTHRGGAARASYATFTTAAAPEHWTIDGSLDEWGDAPILMLWPNAETQVVPDPRAEAIEAIDIFGTLRVAFSETHLLLGLDVTDDVPLINSFKTTEIWRGDSLQIYLGFDGPTRHLNYRPTDFQFGFATGTPSEGAPPLTWNWRSLTSGQDGGGPIVDAQLAVVRTKKGYILEAAVPLSEFGDVSIAPGQALAFDVQLNDVDRPAGDIFDTALMWNGDSDNWRDPSLWGLLRVGPVGE